MDNRNMPCTTGWIIVNAQHKCPNHTLFQYILKNMTFYLKDIDIIMTTISNIMDLTVGT